MEQHGGEVPHDRGALEALPGVGRKTANVVLNVAFGEPTIAVDTHLFRLGNRTGLAPGKTPRAVEDAAAQAHPQGHADACASLADPARPLHLQGADARMLALQAAPWCAFQPKTPPPAEKRPSPKPRGRITAVTIEERLNTRGVCLMRVVVAMSGGVDSSVVAGLLSEQGHEVIGVTLQLYDHGAAAKRRGACCAGEDIHDAKRVADRLGIAHYVIDAEARFRAAVMEDFAASYAAGETPVPCVRCNQSLKFGDLIGMARDLGAEAMATGHYVRRVEGPDGPELHRAVDAARDQSWFLFATTRDATRL